jgi:CubicO group peptidase (beta-lactamase class C family)
MAHYWPAFAAGGKAEVTVAHVLSHAAGVITVPGYEDLLGPEGDGWDQTEEIVRRVASAEPAWRPGSSVGYHGLTMSWLVGELVRRVAGVSVGTLIREEIAGPLGLELDLGTPRDRQDAVAAVILPGPRPAELERQLADPSSLTSQMALAVGGRSMVDEADVFFADPDILELELSASNATATARALATLYGALVDGGSRLVSQSTLEAFVAERTRGKDRVTGGQSRWGLGFERPVPPPPGTGSEWGPHDEAFGHRGYGGQIGFADPVASVGVAFLRSHLAWASPLGALLVDAFYDCVGAP